MFGSRSAAARETGLRRRNSVLLSRWVLAWLTAADCRLNLSKFPRSIVFAMGCCAARTGGIVRFRARRALPHLQ